MKAAQKIPIDRQQITEVERIIRPHVRRTPILEVSGADFRLDSISLIFKLEFLQHAGSFKARGAFTNLLTRDVPKAGVVAASGGNHGVAVAYAAGKLGSVRDGYAVISARCSDYPGFRNVASEQIGEGAAGLERAGVLQEFQFKDEADRIQAEIGAGDFEYGCAADVESDDFFGCGDLIAIYGEIGHGGNTFPAYILPGWAQPVLR